MVKLALSCLCIGLTKSLNEFIDKIITFNDKELLKGNGTISNEQMKKLVGKVYEEFDSKRKQFEAQQADLYDLKEIEALEKDIKLINNEH